MARKSGKRKHFERFVRVFLYAFVPAAIALAEGWLNASSWAIAPILAAASGALGVAYRVCFPGIANDSVVVGRAET
jgi:hypothetical protein